MGATVDEGKWQFTSQGNATWYALISKACADEFTIQAANAEWTPFGEKYKVSENQNGKITISSPPAPSVWGPTNGYVDSATLMSNSQAGEPATWEGDYQGQSPSEEERPEKK